MWARLGRTPSDVLSRESMHNWRLLHVMLSAVTFLKKPVPRMRVDSKKSQWSTIRGGRGRAAVSVCWCRPLHCYRFPFSVISSLQGWVHWMVLEMLNGGFQGCFWEYVSWQVYYFLLVAWLLNLPNSHLLIISLKTFILFYFLCVDVCILQ